MIARNDAIALGVAALVAVAMPLTLLMPGETPGPSSAPPLLPPLSAPAAPPLGAAFERPLFTPADPGLADAPPGDVPNLTGIVGRLDRDAVAMVRAADGSRRTLHIGESVDGWRLASLALDAAFFVRGSERVRVPLPVAPPAAQ